MRSRSWWTLSTLVPVALAALAGTPMNLPKAIATQEKLIAAAPGSAAAQVDLGNLLLLDGRVEEAEAAYRQAIALDASSVAAHFDLGLLLQQQGKESAAAREFKQVIELDSDHAWAHYQLGVVRESRGLDSAAVRSYAKAFALEPRLTFSDVNPHVLENGLMTEAMLHAYRHELPPIQPGAAYEEPARIASILVGGREVPSRIAGETAASPAATATAEPVTAGEAASAAGAGRTLRPGDLSDVGSSGQASPPAPANPHRSGRSIVYDDEGGPEVEIYEPPVPTLRIPTPADPQPGAVAPYQPGLPSSGRLEMKLRDVQGRELARG